MDRFAGATRVRIRVRGVVQGVGFRPHVHLLATGLGLAGHVANDREGAVVEVEGEPAAVATFVARLPVGLPPLARLDALTTEDLTPSGAAAFEILDSDTSDSPAAASIPPDVAPCAACHAEVADPAARRHRYPFTNCTHCGPRFTIVEAVPYDRSRTTMAGFGLCDDCRREYTDPTDRRFHAEPICCPRCGPALRWTPGEGRDPTGEAALEASVRRLRSGGIVAVKGVGGYHLAALAGDEAAVARLRARKHREEKPFALLVASPQQADELCEVDAAAVAALESPAAPIVLLPRRRDAPVAPSVAPGNRWLGVMLPPSPLHALLVDAVAGPLVLTSGNVSDEPIAHRDDDALDRLSPIADGFLTHDRPIHVRADDSVVRVVADRVLPVRRSRGFAPAPILLPWPFHRQLLAVGAQLKNTFCLGKDDRAIVSQHVGDLENPAALAAFESGIAHYCALFDATPEVVAHDLHPDYLSTKHAVELADLFDVDLVGVQHHHAHIASCLADNREPGPVIGVAFDGLGYGTDGGFWGGEVLAADLEGFERLAHLEPVGQPGGDSAVKEPWRMAASHLLAALGDEPLRHLGVAQRHRDRWDDVVSLCRSGVQAPPTTSVGRLFDAVAAIAGVRDLVTYEGQAAIELEQLAAPDESGAYAATITDDRPRRIRGDDLVRAVVADLAGGVPVPVVAARFHNGVAATVVAVCREVRRETGLDTVALSGGVFQNARLLERLVPDLQATGFRVLTHRHVPPNDGGISLGQAAVAAARDRARP